MEIHKIQSWSRAPPGTICHMKRWKGDYTSLSELSNILQNVLNKRIACLTLLQSIQLISLPRSGATKNRHLCGSGERSQEQRRTKVSFSRTMMRALELQQFVKRHTSRRSNVKQWRSQAYSLNGYWVMLAWRHQSDSQIGSQIVSQSVEKFVK